MPTRLSLSLLVLLTFAVPRLCLAQEPIYFWGIERDCEQLSSANRQAEKQLHTPTQPFALLNTPAGKPLPPCQGERCAQILRRACPAASGRLLGGQVVQGRDTTRFRLWLYDLSTSQIAYQDDYTQNPSIADAFIAQAKTLIQNPRFTASPGPSPTYCASRSVRSPSERGEAKGPLYLTVYGDGKQRTALNGALEQQLQLLGQTPLPVPIEARTYPLDVLQRIVSDKQNARVLGAEAKKDGTVRLFLFDQKTNLTYDQIVSCPGCDKDSLISQVKQAVSELLEHCFGDQCAGSGAQPPVEACEPFPEAKCGGLDDLQSSGPRMPTRYIDPATAKLVKGSLWGLFAATAATGITMFALSGTSVGSYQTDPVHTVRNTLDIGAWTATGIAVGLLAVAIPSTIVVDRATVRSVQSSSAEPMLVQCPN